MNKYQRALEALRVDRTWQQVADILTDGWRMRAGEGSSEVVWPSDAWNVWKGESNSSKVNTALEVLDLVAMPGPRWRRCIEWETEEEMLEFLAFTGIPGKQTVTQWAMAHYERDQEHWLDTKDIYDEVEGYR